MDERFYCGDVDARGDPCEGGFAVSLEGRA